MIFPGEIPSSVSEQECEKLAELASNKIVLELGAWQGRTTVCIAQTAAVLHSVDWHKGDAHAGETQTLPHYLRNLHRYGLYDRVVTHIGRFETVLPALCEGYFDMVFLDGFHTYEAVKTDLHRALKVLRPGGVLVFHDYGVVASSHGGDKFGVTEAVDEAFPVDELVGSLAIVHPFKES